MFVANTGEELGLRGADYLSLHPTVPAQSIVGLVDLDMPLLLYDFTDVVAFGADHSTIARAVAEAGEGMGVAVSPDPMPDETLFVRSDHYPFVKRGVPAVFLMTGFANGGQQMWKRSLDGTYHSVKDDLAQPIRWQQGARFAQLNYRIARHHGGRRPAADVVRGRLFRRDLCSDPAEGPPIMRAANLDGRDDFRLSARPAAALSGRPSLFLYQIETKRQARAMKIRNSLKSLKSRHRDCRVIRRRGRTYVINKTNRRFKARQG